MSWSSALGISNKSNASAIASAPSGLVFVVDGLVLVLFSWLASPKDMRSGVRSAGACFSEKEEAAFCVSSASDFAVLLNGLNKLWEAEARVDDAVANDALAASATLAADFSTLSVASATADFSGGGGDDSDDVDIATFSADGGVAPASVEVFRIAKEGLIFSNTLTATDFAPVTASFAPVIVFSPKFCGLRAAASLASSAVLYFNFNLLAMDFISSTVLGPAPNKSY
mmetsp:Transcript_23406/g.33569  ORF Transcript_23406/g.33569 Transcript_23406/m.33569 type:complete len:227 (+) Transcript_23406:146-826(+)